MSATKKQSILESPEDLGDTVLSFAREEEQSTARDNVQIEQVKHRVHVKTDYSWCKPYLMKNSSLCVCVRERE